MKKFIYLLCLIPFFGFVSYLQNTISFNSIIKYIVPVLFLIVSFYAFIRTRPKWLIGKLDKIVYFFFFVFTSYLFVDSFRPEVFYIQEFLVGELYALPYLLPLFMLSIILAPSQLRQYFLICKKLLIPGVLVLIFIIANLNFENWLLHVYTYELFLFSFPILFLVKDFWNNKRLDFFLYIVFVLTIFIAGFYGRRSIFGDLILIFVFYQLITLSSKSTSKLSLIFRYSVLGLFIIPVFLIYSSDFTQFSVFKRGLNKAGWEESRGQVLEEFFSDFGSTKDWLIGRGLNGTVKRSIGSSADKGEGRVIENGYLTLVLKGGNVYFLLILYFFLKAFYLGWFQSNNDFTKAFAALLLIHLLGMIGFNIPVFNHRYILLWLSIPICFSVYYRGLTNEQVKQLIIPR
ncbi:hypothetical protein [Cecembia lonarensis]|uniref:Lipid A core-O-antigen ligase n=1 Tax=Cecembia lonarensis (strain CCUG 58316 / KCTC 22772 / LW9) TaxID=1225176 RepID=K1LA71_CECL9|nr:hypothetical protein [Cecembia lonarensis]EKB49152.1 hypothetical protein B879_02250 [Cecembia lonarensis LW9]